MAVLDKTANGYVGETPVKLLTKEIDFAIDPLAQNDVAELINLPANCRVRNVNWEVTRVEGAGRNFTLGDGADADGYATATSVNTLAKGDLTLLLLEGAPNTVGTYSDGKFYAAADTVDLVAATAGGLTVGKVKVSVLVELYG